MRRTMGLYRLGVAERKRERERARREISERDRLFIRDVIRDRFSLDPADHPKVLDFGCGLGEMVGYLLSQGYDALGCDTEPVWEDRAEAPMGRLARIATSPYWLPYDDGTFHLVYSTSVLEHARNTEECFREIHRVLRPGGIAFHLFPAKWYLPSEPHVRVPLANVFWPRCPDWWIGLWVLLRVAQVPRLRHDWRGMYGDYCAFMRSGVSYLPNRRYRRLSLKVFGNYGSLMDFYFARPGGGYARLARRLPLRALAGWLSSQFRMNMIYQKRGA
jgi:SAM-dependent methyltransferase